MWNRTVNMYSNSRALKNSRYGIKLVKENCKKKYTMIKIRKEWLVEEEDYLISWIDYVLNLTIREPWNVIEE